jgi:hypothetical protein
MPEISADEAMVDCIEKLFIVNITPKERSDFYKFNNKIS